MGSDGRRIDVEERVRLHTPLEHNEQRDHNPEQRKLSGTCTYAEAAATRALEADEQQDEEMSDWDFEVDSQDDQGEEEAETEDPYDHNLDIDAGAQVSDEDLKEQLGPTSSTC